MLAVDYCKGADEMEKAARSEQEQGGSKEGRINPFNSEAALPGKQVCTCTAGAEEAAISEACCTHSSADNHWSLQGVPDAFTIMVILGSYWLHVSPSGLVRPTAMLLLLPVSRWHCRCRGLHTVYCVEVC